MSDDPYGHLDDPSEGPEHTVTVYRSESPYEQLRTRTCTCAIGSDHTESANS